MCYDYSVVVCILFRTGGKEFIFGKNLKGKDCGKGIYQRKDGLYSARFVDKTGKRHAAKSAAKTTGSCQYQNNHGPVCSCNQRIHGSSYKTISAKRGFGIKINNTSYQNGVKMA